MERQSETTSDPRNQQYLKGHSGFQDMPLRMQD